MVTLQCDSVVDRYLVSLRQQYETRREADGCLLLTPFYLPDNTQLGVHLLERANGTVAVTDLGETFDYLFLSGLNITADDKRIARIGERFDVSIDAGEISKTVELGSSSIDGSVNAVIQAVLDMAYLVYTRRPRMAPNFAADVEQLLIHYHRAYEKQVEVVGRTTTHTFDYRFTNRNRPLVLDTLSTTSRHDSIERAQVTSFKALDSRQGEGSDYTFVCLLDDRTPDHDDALSDRTFAPLQGYLDIVLRWSERQRLADLVAA